MSAPLAGVVVVSLEAAISAPFATRQLADLGATVVKVERPEGDFARHYDEVMDGESAFFAWANRGKQSVRLDVKQSAGRDLLLALIAGCDVFVHNLSPRAAVSLGVDAEHLMDRYPHLIAGEISGYGPTGPRAGDKAYDLAIQAEAGVFSVTGDEQMSKVGFSVADICAGMYLLSGVLAALVRRERTGEGAAVRVAMLDALAEWMSAPLYNTVYGGAQPPRTGRRHHAIAPYGTFRLSDDSVVLIAVQSDGEWCSLAEHLLQDPALGQDPRFASNAARVANVVELEAIIADCLGRIDPVAALDRLRQGRIAVARVNDLRGVWEHEQLRTRDRFIEVDSPSGVLQMLAAPFDISGWQPPAGRIPALDEHDPASIESIRERGVGR